MVIGYNTYNASESSQSVSQSDEFLSPTIEQKKVSPML